VITIALDAMGGDHGVGVTLPACRAFLDKHPLATLLLVGTADALAPAAAWPRTQCVVASQVVTMDDGIEVALRRKKDSSMRVAIEQLKGIDDAEPPAHVCVSAGNTGALMAVARYVLKTLDGIDRPAIATVLPNRRDGFTTVLDLGANVDCTPEHLLQFAVMGSALVAAVDGKEEPGVGLLNIGEEAIKGSETIKRAGELLRAVARANSLETNDVIKALEGWTITDNMKPNPTYIRPWDHQFVQDVIIARMKTPEELAAGDKSDFYTVIGFMKGEDVVLSREENPCQLEPYKE